MRFMRLIQVLSTGLLLLAASVVVANEAMPMAKDTVLEAQVMAISHELRCLVCQNQTIADSDAELAIDLRNQVREMIVAGKDKDEIVDYMVVRYGDFIRYRPPVQPTTYVLWFGPFVLFAVGLGVLILNIRSRRQSASEADEEQLSADERTRVQALLKQTSGDENK
ncbi:Cytochrome c heme lyase subunit CcmL [hydrothermal vent metagenome]|uniref:Cytochrome c heme lyase subunit CcmL n=1 Tax=hydrothermal vent metagenome TaxID=652676 RepID=A0A3B1A6T2_9ZZZZ